MAAGAKTPVNTTLRQIKRGHLCLQSALARNPSSPWQIEVTWSGEKALADLSPKEFRDVLTFLRSEAQSLLAFLDSDDDLQVGRIGMLHDGISSSARLVPLTGTKGKWHAVLAPSTRFDAVDHGFVDTISGPRMDAGQLEEWKRALRGGEEENDYAFDGTDSSLFARVVKGEEQQWRVYQDKQSVGVLTPFPNSPYNTVLVPRKWLPSDIFALSLDDYLALIDSVLAALRIFDGVNAQGVAIAFEGLEINYAHIKLYPRFARGTNEETLYMDRYAGFLTSKSGPLLPSARLTRESQDLQSFIKGEGTPERVSSRLDD